MSMLSHPAIHIGETGEPISRENVEVKSPQSDAGHFEKLDTHFESLKLGFVFHPFAGISDALNFEFRPL